MICQHCEAGVPDNSSFCAYCGALFPRPTNCRLDIGKLFGDTFKLYKRNFGTVCLIGAVVISVCCFLTFGITQEPETELPHSLYESVIFPDRSLSRRLEQADRLFESGRTLESAQLLGSILESANCAFAMPEQTEGEPTRTLYQTVNDDIIDRIRKLPKEARDSYAFQFEPTAKRLLENAVTAGSLDEIQQVAKKYFPTTSGASAVFLVGVTQFERGDYVTAFLTFDKLNRLHPSIPETLKPLLEQLIEELGNKLKDNAEQPAQKISESAWIEQIGWRIPAGSPSQNSDIQATAPLLEPNWTVPVFNRLTWERETELLSRLLKIGDDVYIPASQPLVVGDLFITRMPGETLTVDVNSGKRLWVTPASEYRFPEKSGLQQRLPQVAYNTRSTLRLFHWHDRIAQQLSSDGERLFSIEEHDLQASYQTGLALGVPAVRNRQGRVEDRRYDPGNTLTAHDLKTGRILWQVGKFPYVQKCFDASSNQENNDESIFTEDEKAFRETWFLGAPLPLQGRLYVIGETDGVLQLFVLESQTGNLIARQTFAQPTTSLASSFVRRTYPLFPSASGGMIICPTGNGLIVALDATTLEPIWCYSYVSAQKSNQADNNPRNMLGNRPLMPLGMAWNVNEHTIKQVFCNSGWQVPSMIIDGQRIVVAPPDHETLYCLDLLSGKNLWQQFISRTNALYVACVHNNKAFLVTPSNVMVIDMNEGENLTTSASRFPEKLKPAGVGVRSGDQYFIPFTDGHLAVADLNTGKLTWLDASGTSVLPPGEPKMITGSSSSSKQNDEYADMFLPDLSANDVFQEPSQLGNLVGIKGRFFSQSPTQIACFDQKETLEQQAKTLLQANVNDPDGLIKQGRISKMEGKLAEAIDAFRASLQTKPTVEAADFLRKNLMEAIRKDYPAWSHASQELESLAEFPEEWGAILYAQIEGILQSGHIDDLAAVLDKVFRRGVFAQGEEQSVLVPVSTDHSAQLHLALVCLVEQSIAKGYRELKTKWEELAESFLQQFCLSSGVPQRWSMFTSVFRHTAAAERAKHILRHEYEQHHLPLSLNLLEKPPVPPWSELPAPFVWKSAPMDVAMESMQSNEIDRYVNRLLTRVQNPIMERSGENVAIIPFLGQSDSELAAFNYVVVPGTTDGLFFCCCDLSGREQWRLALPPSVSLGLQSLGPLNVQRFSGNGEYTTYIKGFQHFLLFVSGRSLVAIDRTPQSERILWSKTLSSALISQRNSMRMDKTNQHPNPSASFPTNSLFVSPHVVCCWDANCVYGLDPLTGQTLWIRKIPHDHCTLLGDDENLFLVLPDTNVRQIVAIDPAVGREIARVSLPPGGTNIYGTNIIFVQKRGNDYTLSVSDLRDIHDKRRRALLTADLSEGNLIPPIPMVTLQDRVKETSMLQTLKDDRFLSVATWETRSLQIYDMQTKNALLPKDNTLLDFVEETGLTQLRMRCDVELVGDCILVLVTKNTTFQPAPDADQGWGRVVRRTYLQIQGVLGTSIDEGVMMLFDSEGHPDPGWIGPGPMFNSEGNLMANLDLDWKPGRPTKIKKMYRLLDVPDRLPFMLFAVGVSERDNIMLRSEQLVRIMAVDKRTGEYRFRKEFSSDMLPWQSFRVSANMEAQEIIFTTTISPHRTIKMIFVPEQ